MTDRTPLESQERSNLIIMYWDKAGRGVDCPRCNGAALNFEKRNTDSGWIVAAMCPRCGLREVMDRNQDPIVGDGEVLSWAGWEPLIVERYFHGEPNPCPACGAAITATSSPGADGETVHFRCPRCLQVHLHRPGE